MFNPTSWQKIDMEGAEATVRRLLASKHWYASPCSSQGAVRRTRFLLQVGGVAAREGPAAANARGRAEKVRLDQFVP